MKFLLFLVCSITFYICFSLLIGIIGGFGVWNFILLKDLIIFWTIPVSDFGAFWKAFILIVSVLLSMVVIIDFFNDVNRYNNIIRSSNEDTKESKENIEEKKHVNILV